MTSKTKLFPCVLISATIMMLSLVSVATAAPSNSSLTSRISLNLPTDFVPGNTELGIVVVRPRPVTPGPVIVPRPRPRR